MVTAVIAAGGMGTRMGAGFNKVYMPLAGTEIIARTVSAFEDCGVVDEIIVVTGNDDIPLFNDIAKKYGFKKISSVICGGKTRAGSVYNGLKAASGDIVLIHDGARALITGEEITRVTEDCKKYGAAALGVKCKDTLKSSDENGFISGTLDRETTYQIQTPQAFLRSDIIRAHETSDNASAATDDCMLAESIGIKIKITEGSYENIKLTTPSDIAVGEEILKRRSERCG